MVIPMFTKPNTGSAEFLQSSTFLDTQIGRHEHKWQMASAVMEDGESCSRVREEAA